MTITNQWVFIELVGKPVLHALSRIAMKERIDAGRLITYLTVLENQNGTSYWNGKTLYLDASPKMWFDNDTDLHKWINIIQSIYGEPQVINRKKVFVLKPLTKSDALSLAL